jgi:hypothetical protein
VVKELVEAGEFQGMIPEPLDLNSRLRKLINSAPAIAFIKGISETFFL